MSIKIYPTRCEAVDEDGEVVFTVATFDADCYNLEVNAVVDAENWPRIAKAIEFTLAYMSAGLMVADPLNTPAAIPERPDDYCLGA